jgi:hypothetical protein
MRELPRQWVLLPFRGEFAQARVVPVLQEALFQGRVERLNELVIGFAFSSEELQQDAEARAARLVDQAMGGGIDYIGEGPYPAHWRMDANRGVFHYAGTSPWCFDAYRLLLDLAVMDPPPQGWAREFPSPDAGSLDAGGTLWDFFGDLSNEGHEFDSYMAKLFDSFPVWLSPPESSFTGFLSETDVPKVRTMIDALGESRRQKSYFLREFHRYLDLAGHFKLGLTAAPVPVGQRWQEETPRRIAEHW